MVDILVESGQTPEGGIVVPKEVIRPFGRALNQMFGGSVARIVNNELLKRLFPGQEEFTSSIEHNTGQLTQILSNLESSRDVWLVKYGGEHMTFRFSKEQDPDVVIPPGEVVINQDLSHQLIEACSDTLMNQLNGIYGFSELLGSMAEAGEGKDAAEEVYQASQEFLDLYRQNFTEVGELRVTTDDAGHSSILL